MTGLISILLYSFDYDIHVDIAEQVNIFCAFR